MSDELIASKRRLARIRLWHVWLSAVAITNVIAFAWLRMPFLAGIAFGGAMIPPVYLWWSGREDIPPTSTERAAFHEHFERWIAGECDL